MHKSINLIYVYFSVHVHVQVFANFLKKNFFFHIFKINALPLHSFSDFNLGFWDIKNSLTNYLRNFFKYILAKKKFSTK